MKKRHENENIYVAGLQIQRRGEILTDGSYYCVLNFDGSSKIYKGFITILRNN